MYRKGWHIHDEDSMCQIMIYRHQLLRGDYVWYLFYRIERPEFLQTKPMANTNETESEAEEKGGFVALSGFYFQFLATFSGYVENVVIGSNDNEVRNGDTLLGLEIAGKGAGTDAAHVSSQDKKIRIIQIKFSNTPNENDIAPKEANDIFEKMHKFADSKFPKSQGWKHEFVLLTNRDKSINVKEVGEGKSSKFRTEYPKLEEYLHEAEWKIQTEEQCFKIIEKSGREFGMSGDRNSGDIRKGLAFVWDEFFKVIKNQRNWLTKEEVEEVFTDYANPRRWTDSSCRESVKRGITEFLRRVRIEPADKFSTLVERPALVEEIRRAVGEFPLVVISGQGGNGKSTLLGQIANQWAEDAFAAGASPLYLKNYWPSECVSNWRNILKNQPIESVDLAIERMPQSEPGDPIVIFALDGADETTIHNGSVSHLILDFNRHTSALRSRASLIITCRDIEKVEGLNLLSQEKDKDYKLIIVDEFSYPEMINSLRRGHLSLGNETKNRLLAAISANDETDGIPENTLLRDAYATVGTQANRASSEKPISRDVLSALRHPVVWKYFYSTELDDEKRQLLLDDDINEWGTLAHNVVEWFGAKCNAHIAQSATEEIMDDAIDILIAVGKKCHKTPYEYRIADWRKAAKAEVVGNSRRIFRQAIYSGLIIGDPDPQSTAPWRWRHAFLPRYLLAKAMERESS